MLSISFLPSQFPELTISLYYLEITANVPEFQEITNDKIGITVCYSECFSSTGICVVKEDICTKAKTNYLRLSSFGIAVNNSIFVHCQMRNSLCVGTCNVREELRIYDLTKLTYLQNIFMQVNRQIAHSVCIASVFVIIPAENLGMDNRHLHRLFRKSRKQVFRQVGNL